MKNLMLSKINNLSCVVNGVLYKTSTALIGGCLFVFGLLGALIWVYVRSILAATYDPKVVQTLDAIIMVGVLFLWGLIGVVCVARREFPQLITIRGKPAIFAGVLLTLIFWGSAIWIIIRICNFM